jgi:histidyl-tRNA synthetase
VTWLDQHAGELDEETVQKRRTSPLRVFDNFDAKPERTRAALAQAPKIGEALCDECREHFAAVRTTLDAYGVPYELRPTLVRGLDYYTRTAWEFMGPERGAQSTLSGGGRYDGLIEELDGPPTPGVGFGAGLERLLLALENEGLDEAEAPVPDLFFLVDADADRTAALVQMARLRGAGIACDTDYAGRSPKGQRTQLARSGARGWVHVRADGAVVKREREADEEEVAVDEIAATVLG